MTLIQKLTIGQSEKKALSSVFFFVKNLKSKYIFVFISQNLKINNFWKKKKERIALLILTS